MATTRSTSEPSDADFDLSALTHRLEVEILSREVQPAARPLPSSKDRLAIMAPPEAIVTLGVGICAGAIWLARTLPY